MTANEVFGTVNVNFFTVILHFLAKNTNFFSVNVVFGTANCNFVIVNVDFFAVNCNWGSVNGVFFTANVDFGAVNGVFLGVIFILFAVNVSLSMSYEVLSVVGRLCHTNNGEILWIED